MNLTHATRHRIARTASGEAFSEVPEDWEGHCALRLDGSLQVSAVFPDVIQAQLAAKEAIEPHAGLWRAVIVPTLADVTDLSGWAWAHS